MAFHPDALASVLAEYELQQPLPLYTVALSGGADSVALLVGLSRIVSSERILALHFNHRIHPDASAWVDHCRGVCERLRVRFKTGEWHSQEGRSLRSESEAREARYQWLGSVVPGESILLTGHHLDDQAETVLMSLVEGRSLERVAGIRQSRLLDFGDTRRVVRPLLGFTHEELCQFLSDNAIEWIEDSANIDRQHARNMIRQDILPVLNARWPQSTRSLGKFALALGDALGLIDDYADLLLEQLRRPQQRTLFCQAAPLGMADQLLSSGRTFSIVIRRWCHQAGVRSPGDKQLLEFRQQLMSATSGQHCALSTDDSEMVLYDGNLYLIKRWQPEEAFRVQCETTAHRLDAFLSVSFRDAENGLDPQTLKVGDLHWCQRKPGQRFTVSIAAGSTTLKKAMQGARVAPWLRQGLPVLVQGETVIWAHGLGINAQFMHKAAAKDCLVPQFSVTDTRTENA